MKTIAEKNETVLLLDAGGIYPTERYSKRTAEIITRIGFEAMDYMNYQAVNMGLSDFMMGPRYLLELFSTSAFPILTSNLVYKASGLTFGKKYVIRNIRGVRVGILGIMSEDNLNVIKDQEFTDALTVLPPEPILATLIPEVRQKADLVILLSQAGFDSTSQLIKKTSGIDLAIVGNNSRDELPKCGGNDHRETYETVNGTLIAPVRRLGRALGYVKIKLDPADHSVEGMEFTEIELSMNVAMDSGLERISGADIYVTAMKEMKKNAEKVRGQLEKEIEQFKEYSPEEYFNHILSEKNKS